MRRFAQVAIPPLDKILSYLIPESLSDIVEIGHFVQVWIGKRIEQGFIVGFSTEIDFESSKIKPLYKLVTPVPYFCKEQLPFFEWVAKYYCDSLSNVIETATPIQSNKKYVTYLRILDFSVPIRGKTQQAIIDYIVTESKKTNQELVKLDSLRAKFPNSFHSIKLLKEKKVIEYLHVEFDKPNNQHQEKLWAKKTIELNEEQNRAYELIKNKIDKKTFQAITLHGVTGSGKTEVYIESCLYALSKGLSSLIIVPEIALTPQLVDRFYARFGSIISVLHSGLDKRNRWESWLSLLKGETKIAIGARSAVFAPTKHLGLIIVDEEHDSSYKQAEGFRYNGRDIAIARANLEKIPVILGSATPSLETFNNSIKNKYKYIELKSKYANSKTAETKIVNLNNFKPWEMPSKNISPILREKLKECLEKNEQAFILYNRRGFSIFVQCEKCGYVVNCPRCSISLSFHKSSNILICHLCGTTREIPIVCPECKKNSPATVESKFAQRGAGTERVYDEIKELFPNAKVDRLDRDSVNNEKDYREVLDKIRNKETDILVGTQMIAKGHDIENVTFVGIIDCDVGISFPDFRSTERAFQLLTQVAGRAGRGDKLGTVIFQTRLPNHLSIQTASQNNYIEFAKRELHDRRSLNYPPFVRLLRIISLSPSETSGFKFLESLKENLRIMMNELNDIQILGPVSAPILKIKDNFRHHIIIKSKSHASLQRILKIAKEGLGKKKDVKVVFDLDPVDML